MLIRFSVENFLSFNEEIEFSMIAGRARKHPHHVIRDTSRDGINILKAGIIYGPNASGKSNLIKAMHFAKEIITKGTDARKRIPVIPFKLDPSRVNEPSKFEFEFRVDRKYYLYGFCLDDTRIHSEWLYEITKTKEHLLFERKTSEENQTTIEFGKIKFESSKERDFFEFTAMGTRANQLFLTESIDRSIDEFSGIFRWFDKVLTIIFPESIFASLELHFVQEDSELGPAILKYLKLFDIGISDIKPCKVNLDELTEIPDDVKEDLLADLTEDAKVLLKGPEDSSYLLMLDDEKQVTIYKLITVHKRKVDGFEAEIDMTEESDGTQRLLDLIPALIALLQSERVFVVDELERSLHPRLSFKFLELFLNNKREQQSQIIVTTHEVTLLDLELLRRDEIWFVEKNQDGESVVYSLEEFAPRYDKDIRKGYFLGRFGAIPVVKNVSDLGWAN